MFELLKRKKKILIVDDDKIILDTLGFILKNEKYQALRAKDSKEFFKMMKKNPDLILMDINLKEIKGEELVKDAQIEDKVIFMSSAWENKSKHPLFMKKPFNPVGVRNTIRNYFINNLTKI